jgi:hypothetical protein
MCDMVYVYFPRSIGESDERDVNHSTNDAFPASGNSQIADGPPSVVFMKAAIS